MSRIRLLSSASGMNCDGEMSPCPGSRQRSSASAPTTRPSRKIHLGLVQDDELVALERAAQLALQHEPLDGRGIHVRYVKRPGIAAVLLGVVHRRIGVADQVDHVLGIVRADRDADARGQVDLLLIHVERAADLVEQRAGEGAEARTVVEVRGQVIHEHRELIAGEPADHGLLAQHPRQPLTQDFQRAIAGGVPEGVVDVLEAVQVEIQEGASECWLRRERAMACCSKC